MPKVRTKLHLYFVPPPPPPPPPQFFKIEREIAPSSFAHEVVLVTYMEHLSSCQSGFLVVCTSQSSVFWVFVIFVSH